MRAQEKQLIFDLLKAAAAESCGYVPKKFAVAPQFSDDAPLRAQVPPAQDSVAPQNSQAPSGLTLEDVGKKVLACRNCRLCEQRRQAVPGMGVENPLVMVIGEGPGEQEDIQGLPFVGPAGQLLDKMLAAIRLSRQTNCYIANIVKCRPPNNRAPLPDEAAACEGFLRAQVRILRPKMILAMGRTAAQALLKTDEGIGRLRGGRIFALPDLGGIPMMATYHPSALLRNADLKAPAWEDLKSFASELGRRMREEGPDVR